MTLNKKINFFKNETRRFMDFFGLHNWDITFAIEEDSDNEASCWSSSIEDLNSNRTITIAYEVEWLKQENNLKVISKTAFHEVMEIMLMKLRLFAENKTLLVTEREIDDEVHNIIRIFENRIFDKLSKEKLK